MKASDVHEQALLNRIQCGDYPAFKTLFHRYYPALCSFAAYYLDDEYKAEELVSDLFLKFWQNRKSLQVQNLRMYLFTATKNRCLNLLRKSGKNFLVFDEAEHDRVSDDCPLAAIEFKETSIEIEKLIQLLPEKMRACFIMSRIDGLNYAEIAELFDISIRTVEDHIYKAVLLLKKAYQKKHT